MEGKITNKIGYHSLHLTVLPQPGHKISGQLASCSVTTACILQCYHSQAIKSAGSLHLAVLPQPCPKGSGQPATSEHSCTATRLASLAEIRMLNKSTSEHSCTATRLASLAEIRMLISRDTDAH